MDRGGITIGDDVFIGPRVQLITTNLDDLLIDLVILRLINGNGFPR